MRYLTPITYGDFFHIYNHGIDSCDLFRSAENYERFLALYDEYISPVADTFAWVLMKNHFHILVRIKDKDEIGFMPVKPKRGSFTTGRNELQYTSSLDVKKNGELKKYHPSHQFSHLFNAYAQAFNLAYHRTGKLFDHPFKRKRIDNKWYLKQVILYIHNNPVHHGFCSHPLEYPWNSYLSCISAKATRLKRDKVIEWFCDKDNFKVCHHNKLNIEEIEYYLDL